MQGMDGSNLLAGIAILVACVIGSWQLWPALSENKRSRIVLLIFVAVVSSITLNIVLKPKDSTLIDSSNNSEQWSCQYVAEILASNPRLSTFTSLMIKSELFDALNSEGRYAVFAPTNDAFKEMDKKKLDYVMNEEDMMRNFFMFHVVEKIESFEGLRDIELSTMQGEDIVLDSSGAQQRIEGVNITKSDISGCNGVVNIINGVLIPLELAFK